MVTASLKMWLDLSGECEHFSEYRVLAAQKNISLAINDMFKRNLRGNVHGSEFRKALWSHHSTWPTSRRSEIEGLKYEIDARLKATSKQKCEANGNFNW
jgi:hypothetical protein